MKFESIDDVACGNTFSVRRLADLIKLVRKYSNPRFTLCLDQHNVYLVNSSKDYDGHPFEDFFDLFYSPSTQPYVTKATWGVGVVYEATHSDDFDYEAMASRDTSTAYRRGSTQKDVLTRFKLSTRVYYIPTAMTQDRRSALETPLVELEYFLLALQDATSSIEAWSQSGLPMLVACTVACGSDPKIFSSAELTQFSHRGISLENISARLTCKSCGRRGPQILPAIYGDTFRSALAHFSGAL